MQFLIAFSLAAVSAISMSVSADPDPFLREAKGHYEIFVTAGSPATCPKAFDAVTIEGDSLNLMNIKSSKGRKNFWRIDNSFVRTEPSLGKYVDTLSKLEEETVTTRARVTTYARRCEGLIFVECEQWWIAQSFTLTGFGAKIAVTAQGATLDKSGFPVGTCDYLLVSN